MQFIHQPVQLKNITIKNPIIRSATWENLTTPTGHLTNELYEIYENLAKNEVGLIITGYAFILQSEQPNPGMMGIYDDSFIEEYQELTKRVHQHGAKIILQLAYGGTKTTFNVGQRVIFSPSNIPETSTKTQGQEMTINDIKTVIQAFVDASRRAKEAGFDGVQIHGAHTYLLNQFLSPYYNKRTDEYGGSLENRCRIFKEIITAIHQEIGLDYLVLVKLTCLDFIDDGLHFFETKEICKYIEAYGYDGIEITGNVHGKANTMTNQSFDGHQILKEGYFLEYANVIANLVSIPVMTVGGFSDPKHIEEVLKTTNIKMISISRPLMSDPDLVKNWQNKNYIKSRCLHCSKCRTKIGNYCTVFQNK